MKNISRQKIASKMKISSKLLLYLWIKMPKRSQENSTLLLKLKMKRSLLEKTK